MVESNPVGKRIEEPLYWYNCLIWLVFFWPATRPDPSQSLEMATEKLEVEEKVH